MSVLPEQSPIQSEQNSDNLPNSKDSRCYKYLVFIGRFQPFHMGHKAVVDEALKRAENVIMLIGSANMPRSLRNPFTVEERAQMIKGAYPKQDADRIHCVGLDDALYNGICAILYQNRNSKLNRRHCPNRSFKRQLLLLPIVIPYLGIYFSS